MNSFFKKFLPLFFGIILSVQYAYSKEVIAILSDNLKPVSTNYIIYPELSNLISQDLANRLNYNANLRALPVSNSINNAQKKDIHQDILRFAKEYQYTYNINYNILRRISSRLESDYIMLISSGLDVETEFLKETFWNKIPIAGENSINPSYRVVTQVTLIDPDKELIILDKNYVKILSSKNMDLAMPSFAPAQNQLNRMKNFSIKFTKDLAAVVEATLIPEEHPEDRTFVQEVNYRVKIKPSLYQPPKDQSLVKTKYVKQNYKHFKKRFENNAPVQIVPQTIDSNIEPVNNMSVETEVVPAVQKTKKSEKTVQKKTRQEIKEEKQAAQIQKLMNFDDMPQVEEPKQPDLMIKTNPNLKLKYYTDTENL
ncbi:MAG: hypothetical protein PHV37_09600 [Candidatus Gastranaerophilales bacterium]|nr:hypothetical protein [Candidatus Gastranaerophilales bacterium]